MERQESLRDYLTYTKDVEQIQDLFYALDMQLKTLHYHGYYVQELNLDTIVMDRDRQFEFASLGRTKKEEAAYRAASNIQAFSVLSVGSYMSVEHGVCDYTKLDINVIRNNWDDVLPAVPRYSENDNYYEQVIVYNQFPGYYSDYVRTLDFGGNSNQNTMVKSTQAGKYLTERNSNQDFSYSELRSAAFMKGILYPIMLITIAVVAYAIYMVIK